MNESYLIEVYSLESILLLISSRKGELYPIHFRLYVKTRQLCCSFIRVDVLFYKIMSALNLLLFRFVDITTDNDSDASKHMLLKIRSRRHMTRFYARVRYLIACFIIELSKRTMVQLLLQRRVAILFPN